MTTNSDDQLYTNVEIKNLEGSEVEIRGEIPTAVVDKHRAGAIKKLGKDKEIPGFRKGHVPENILIEHIGEPAILYEVAEEALALAYPQIITDKNIEAVGRPHITITKLAPGNPIGFTARTAVMPKTEPGNYKKVAEKVVKENPLEDVIVTDDEVEAVLNQIRESKKNISQNKKGSAETTDQKNAKEDLPELTDEDARKLGNFKDFADLKVKLRENIKLEKETKQKEVLREKIVGALIEEATLTVPQLFVEAETDKIMHEFKHRLASMGLSFEDYLKRVEKTEEVLRSETHPEAEKRAKLQLILSTIAEKEELQPDLNRVNKEVAHILSHHEEANEHTVRTYVETLLTNEKVFEFLEKN